MARRLRGKDDAQSQAALRGVWIEILEHEMWFVTTKVRLAGIERNGRSTVDEQDIGDVVGEVMKRLIRFSSEFKGSEIGQFRKAINQAVQWEVATYGESQARKRENEQAVNPAHFDPGSVGPDERPGFNLFGLADLTSTSDRAEALEQLSVVSELDERERSVVVMRATGHTSKEIAAELELSPANVDQIFHRAIKQLRKLVAERGADG
jgi:RNA polymerase sigma factor (sigma-70 family)